MFNSSFRRSTFITFLSILCELVGVWRNLAIKKQLKAIAVIAINSAVKVSLLEQKANELNEAKGLKLPLFVCQIGADQIDCQKTVTYFFLSQVVDIENGDELGPNKEGEICVKGPTVMKGRDRVTGFLD